MLGKGLLPRALQRRNSTESSHPPCHLTAVHCSEPDPRAWIAPPPPLRAHGSYAPPSPLPAWPRRPGCLQARGEWLKLASLRAWHRCQRSQPLPALSGKNSEDACSFACQWARRHNPVQGRPRLVALVVVALGNRPMHANSAGLFCSMECSWRQPGASRCTVVEGGGPTLGRNGHTTQQ